ncbi:MAG: hypothetical protein ACO3H5_04620 [Candidatus Nanopelagicales bacterium]
MLRSNLRNNVLLVAYFIFIVIFVFSTTGQIYGVNDDVIIQEWLSGAYTGKTEFMIRGSATPKLIFGLLVSSLYGWIPQINWFSIILLMLTLLSWHLLGLLALKCKSFFAIISFVIISFLYLLWFIPSPTYTAAAVILTFSTLIYFSDNLLKQEFNITIVIVVLLFIFAYLIRPESFYLGTAVSIPFIIYSAKMTTARINVTTKKLLMLTILSGTFILIDSGLEKLVYQKNSDWNSYKEWESARYEIQGNAAEKAISEDPSKYNWSLPEVELFKSYNFLDKKSFNTDKLQKLNRDIDATEANIDSKFLLNAHQKIFDSASNWEWPHLINLISLFYLFFLMLSIPKVKLYFILSFSSLGILYVIMLYVAGFLRQPERVQVSFIFLSILLSFISFIFNSRDSANSNYIDLRILSLLILVLIVLNSGGQARNFMTKIQKSTVFFWNEQIRYLSSFPDDSIFLGNASQFRNNWRSPYLLERSEVENRILSFGWHSFSPHWSTRAENLGLNPNQIIDSLIEDPRVYLVSDASTMDYIEQFMQEKNYIFNDPIKVGVMSHLGNDYVVWKFKRND